MAITTQKIRENIDGNRLGLLNMNLTDDDIPVICEFLNKNPTIKILHVNGNRIGDKGAEYLAGNKTLTELDVSANDIGDEGG